MHASIRCFALLALAGLGSCSIARHGPVSVPTARINWPRAHHAGKPGSIPHTRHRVGHGQTPTHRHAHKATHAGRLKRPHGVDVIYPQPGLTTLTRYELIRPMRPVGGGSQRPGRDSSSAKPPGSLNRLSPATIFLLRSPVNAIN